jgi:hypothetical protein
MQLQGPGTSSPTACPLPRLGRPACHNSGGNHHDVSLPLCRWAGQPQPPASPVEAATAPQLNLVYQLTMISGIAPMFQRMPDASANDVRQSAKFLLDD